MIAVSVRRTVTGLIFLLDTLSMGTPAARSGGTPSTSASAMVAWCVERQQAGTRLPENKLAAEAAGWTWPVEVHDAVLPVAPVAPVAPQATDPMERHKGPRTCCVVLFQCLHCGPSFVRCMRSMSVRNSVWGCRVSPTVHKLQLVAHGEDHFAYVRASSQISKRNVLDSCPIP